MSEGRITLSTDYFRKHAQLIIYFGVLVSLFFFIEITDPALRAAFIFPSCLVAMIIGSDYIVDGASRLSKRFKISEFFIAIIVLDIGGSLPEILTTIASARVNEPGLAIASSIGSILVQVTLLAGIICMISPLSIKRKNVLVDGSFFICIIALFALFLSDLYYSRFEAIVLFLVFAMYVLISFKRDKKEQVAEEVETINPSEEKKYGEPVLYFLLLIAVISLFYIPDMMVSSVIDISAALAIPTDKFGIIILSLLVTAQEIFVAVIAVKKKHSQFALGAVIGASMIDVVFALGIGALIFEFPIQPFTFMVLTPVILMVSGIVLIFMRTSWRIKRWEGLLLILFYVAFVSFVIVI